MRRDFHLLNRSSQYFGRGRNCFSLIRDAMNCWLRPGYAQRGSNRKSRSTIRDTRNGVGVSAISAQDEATRDVVEPLGVATLYKLVSVVEHVEYAFAKLVG